MPVFAYPQDIDVGGYNVGTVAVNTADFNGDGKPDVVATTATGVGANPGLSVALNSTPGGAATLSFGAPQTVAPLTRTGQIAIADVNGDGRPDVVISGSDAPGGVIFLDTTASGASTASFAAPAPFVTTGANPTRAVVTADVNGDGRPDIVTTDTPPSTGVDTVSVNINTTPAGGSSATFSPSVNFDTDPAGLPAQDIVVGDLNGDGKPDLAVSSQRDPSMPAKDMSILINQTAAGAATPTFASAYAVAAAPRTVGLGLADVNGDGRLDLLSGDTVASTIGSDTLAVQINTTATGAATASFAAPVFFDTYSVGPIHISTPDVNGDGRPDVVTHNQFFPTQFQKGHDVLINTTPTGAATPTFGELTAVDPAGNYTSIFPGAIADFNGDGKPDFVDAFLRQVPSGFGGPGSPEGIVGTARIDLNVSTPDPQLSPDALVFHDQPVGTTSAAQTVTVTNAGAWTLDATGTSLTGDTKDFAVTSDTCSNVPVHVTETCLLKIAFTPTATGAREATLSVSSNAPGGPRQIHLAGNTAEDTTPPNCKVTGVKQRYKAKTFVRKGLTTTVSCNEAAALLTQLVARLRTIHGRAVTARVGELVIGEKSTPLGSGRRTMKLKPSRKFIRRLGHRYKLYVVVTATDSSRNVSKISKKISVR